MQLCQSISFATAALSSGCEDILSRLTLLLHMGTSPHQGVFSGIETGMLEEVRL